MHLGKTTKKTTSLASVEKAMADLQGRFGSHAVMRLGSAKLEIVPSIPTGSFMIDRAIGVGGWPRGRIIELFGPESSGKTTLALHAIAKAQAEGDQVAFIDAEHALDMTYARALGVNIKHLLVSQPDSGEQALEITDTLIRSGGMGLIVIDSVAALVPKSEIDGEMGAPSMGAHARLMSQALRKLTGPAMKAMTTIIFINQIRYKIGVIYGSPEVTTGGNALRFYASVRVDVRRRAKLTGESSEIVGNIHEAKIVKNKCAPPFRIAEFEIIFGKGIDQLNDLINIALELGVLEKRGSYYGAAGVKETLCQGRFNLRKLLEDDGDLRKNVETLVTKRMAEWDPS